MKFYKKTDLLIIGAILVLAAGVFLFYQVSSRDREALAQIYYESQLVMTVDLTTGEDKDFTVPENDHVVFHQYSDGSIAFIHSDCPDKICIRAGRLKLVGESATCLPNKMTLKLVAKNGSSNDDVDIVVGN